MEAKWFNVYGLIFVAVILIPNVIFAMKCKDGFVNKWNNKLVETVEQIGRFACFILMIFSNPGHILWLVFAASVLSLSDCGHAAGGGLLPDLADLLSQKQHVPCAGAFHYPFGFVPAERHSHSLNFADRCGRAVCAQPYSDFV